MHASEQVEECHDTTFHVVRDDEDETYNSKVYEPHDKVAGSSYLGPNMTEAQAAIIAFALNAVSQGATLQAWIGDNCLELYSGPTEGVRVDPVR
jgi:hypothetical protein